MNIIERFEYKSVKLIAGWLNYNKIKLLYDKLNENTSSIHSILLDSRYSLLDLTIL